MGGIPTGWHRFGLKIEEVGRVPQGWVIPGLQKMVYKNVARESGSLGRGALLMVAHINLYMTFSHVIWNRIQLTRSG